jgi:hypothetical protein
MLILKAFEALENAVICEFLSQSYLVFFLSSTLPQNEEGAEELITAGSRNENPADPY